MVTGVITTRSPKRRLVKSVIFLAVRDRQRNDDAMARTTVRSWCGALRHYLTDPERPNTLVVQTEIHLPDLEANNRALAELHPRRSVNKLLARVPMTVWEQSVHEKWGDDDWKRWLNDPDNAPFRVWPGRV